MHKQLSAQRLKEKTAFVSGGLRGIGRASVERFLAEGATVVFGDIEPPNSSSVLHTLAELDGPVSYIQADVTREDDWQRVLDTLTKDHRKLHILVNNAGVDQTGPIEAITLETWRRVMDINAAGAFLGVKTLQAIMAKSGTDFRGGGSIINISSIMGLVGNNESSAYNASKGAVRLFTKSIGIEFATKKIPIRVNSVHPGCVLTPLLRNGFQNWIDNGFAKSSEDLIALMESRTPMGRLGNPEDIAGAISFLASEDSAYMTGAEIVIDGGWTAQ